MYIIFNPIDQWYSNEGAKDACLGRAPASHRAATCVRSCREVRCCSPSGAWQYTLLYENLIDKLRGDVGMNGGRGGGMN